MHKGIIFLENVEQSTRQNVLNFVKEWESQKKHITVKTSGSTGEPKEIKLLKHHIKASAKATIDFFKLKKNQTILLTLSAEYIAGKMMIVRALENNMTIIVTPLQSNPLNITLKHKIHFSAFVPLQIHSILKNEISKANYLNIDNVIIGGGTINQQLESEIYQLTNTNFATFGMTETISHIALRNISKKESFYTALPHVKFTKNKNNCLIINAPLVNESKGIETTDIVELISNTQFVWKGRADFVINSGGIKLHPEELEKRIEHLLPKNRYYFTSIKDEILGEKLILKIESKEEFSVADLSKKLTSILTNYETPKSIEFIKKFKETKTGKLIR